ncbi:MAG: nuclear transport factor 2 family protein [Methylococcaceae bacterium]|uniref:nuclear transport factor 2 family protein n=1 Tax=Methyloglobulus sp. TaxID=2518622 RepID=UPI0017B117A1|nr:nuclear transport factor 2 family protein [Methylococcaceae bacterium]
MLTLEFAESFAKEWVHAWNSHDLELILSHYSDNFVMSSPRIAVVVGEPSGTLKGKPAIRAYWEKALALAPNLYFELVSVLVGSDSITLYYKGVRGMAAEVFFFNSSHKVIQACAHYA